MRYNFSVFVCFILLNVFSACNNNKGADGMNNSVDDYMRFQLNGDWRDTNNLRAWRFDYDSVYSYDRNKAFAYRLDSLKLRVKFIKDSYEYFGWINIKGDTLFFNAEDSTFKLYRVTKKTAAELKDYLKRTNQR